MKSAERDQMIVKLYADGKSYGRISSELGISRNVVAGVVNRKTVANRGGVKRQFDDLTGLRFHKLRVVERAKNRDGSAQYWCACDCGTWKVVPGGALKSRHVRSCGCATNELRVNSWRRTMAAKRLQQVPA